jgi:hypothetical protein
LINEGGKLPSALNQTGALHSPALYEKALRGVSNNILKKAKGKIKKAEVKM